MDSSDRSVSIVVGFVSAALVAIIFLMGSCSVKEAEVNLPNHMLTTKTEYNVKMACIAARGEYNDYNRCTFQK